MQSGNTIKDHLTRSQPVRGHFTVIFLIMIAFGVSLGRLFLKWGMTDFVLRDALVIPFSYLFFFVAVKHWLKIIEIEKLSVFVTEDEVAETPSQDSPPAKREKSQLFDYFPDVFEIDSFVFLVLILAIIGVFVWTLFEGPAILVETATEVALSVSLAKSVGARKRPHWSQGLLKRTFYAFLIFWIAAVLLLGFLNQSCPGKVRLSQWMTQCLGDH